MKAAVLDYDGISIRDVELPIVGANEVMVSVSYCGICGSDIPRVVNKKVKHLPIVLGHEFSGMVVKLGHDVKKLKVGDKVVCAPLLPCHNCKQCGVGDYSLCSDYSFIGSRVNGGFAEYVSMPEANALKVPDNIPLLDASLIEPCTVARHAYNFVDVKNKVVCIVGNGIIGLFTAQWAKLLGAYEVALVTNTKKNWDAKAVFVDKIVDRTQIFDLKSDVVFDCVGNNDSFVEALHIATNKATIVMIGTPKKDMSIKVADWENINRKELSIIGSWMSYSSPFPGKEWNESIDMMSAGIIHVIPEMISEIVPVGDIACIFENISQKKGRVVIKINGE